MKKPILPRGTILYLDDAPSFSSDIETLFFLELGPQNSDPSVKFCHASTVRRAKETMRNEFVVIVITDWYLGSNEDASCFIHHLFFGPWGNQRKCFKDKLPLVLRTGASLCTIKSKIPDHVLSRIYLSKREEPIEQFIKLLRDLFDTASDC